MSTDKTPAPLIVFGEDWGRHPSSTQHFIRRLKIDRPVVWVDSIGMRRPRLGDIARAVRKIRAMIGAGKTSPVIHEDAPDAIIAPKAVSWPGSRIASWINRRTLGKCLRQKMMEIGIEKPILWTSLPTAVDVVGELDEIACVYYAGDDFSALAGVDHVPVARMEQRLAEKADIIIAASEAIATRFPRSKTFVIPHGADISLFSSPTKAPADLLHCAAGRQIAGFYGAIDDWFDVDLMKTVAHALPHWEFVLIGSVRTNVEALMGLDNIHFLGPKPHHELPGYVQNWTVSLLPFKDVPQIQACNPLKLREYLAAGTPIVSTPFPAAKGFAEHIAFADAPTEFATSIAQSTNDTARARRARHQSVVNQTWEARTKEVAVLLEALQIGTAVST